MEISCIERLWGLKFDPDPKYNDQVIRSIAKDAEKTWPVPQSRHCPNRLRVFPPCNLSLSRSRGLASLSLLCRS